MGLSTPSFACVAGTKEDSYGLSITLQGRTPMNVVWFSTFWAASPEAVPVIHFGEPLKPQMLRFKEFAIGAGPRRLSIAFINPGRGEGATSRLSIDALPVTTIPEVRINWPVAQGAVPLSTTTQLVKRCCYWEFYDETFKVPAGAIEGTATVSVSFQDGEFPFELVSNELKVPVRSKVSGSETE